jgi:hypothetical protein
MGPKNGNSSQALLLAGEEYIDEIIVERSGMHRRGIEALRKRFVEEGFEATVEGKPRGHRPCSIRGEDEARLIALVCGPAPEGSARWTLRLLEEAWVRLENRETERVSRETIRRTLKKTSLNPGEAGNSVYRRRQTRSL